MNWFNNKLKKSNSGNLTTDKYRKSDCSKHNRTLPTFLDFSRK